MTKTFELTVTRIVPASQKEVFDAWLDPEVLPKFMRPAEGMEAPEVEIDAQEGGEFLIMMKAGDKGLPHRGRYQTIRRYDRLVFTWLSEHTTPDSLVTIDFEPVSEHETKVVLHHAGLPSEEARNAHEGGWGRILDKQAEVLG